MFRRFYKTIKKYSADKIIRITGVPSTNIKLLKKILFFQKNRQYDYVSNTLNPTYPDSLDMKFLINVLKRGKI